jgi:hypothetical protein
MRHKITKDEMTDWCKRAADAINDFRSRTPHIIPDRCETPLPYFRVTLEEAKDPVGMASASMRGCMCCGRDLSSMGGPGYWLCFD